MAVLDDQTGAPPSERSRLEFASTMPPPWRYSATPLGGGPGVSHWKTASTLFFRLRHTRNARGLRRSGRHETHLGRRSSGATRQPAGPALYSTLTV